ncbi:MAG: glycosyltransferase family 39 protein [Chloroflexi bacterium]|nr:glycosyltransferase family 39 protein [Chloroflexota bacterium]
MFAHTRHLAVVSLLGGILVVAFALRIFGLNWDDNHHIHPDERWITMVAMDTYVPAQWSDALNPRRSALNPYWDLRTNQPRHFAYGSFPLYLVRLVATGISDVAASDLASGNPAWSAWRSANDYDHINLVGRLISALFDTATVFLVFLLGRRIYGPAVGLLGAALSALAVQQIQLAHFYAFDGVTTTVIVAAVYFGVRVVQDGQLSDTLWLGAMVALAIASKFSALPLLAIVGLAHLLRVAPVWTRLHPARPAGALGIVAHPPLWVAPVLSIEVVHAVSRILLCFLFALLIFFAASPFTFLDFNGYVASISEQSEMVRGTADFPYTRQYINTGLSYWFENWTFWAAGPALALPSLLGLGLVAWRAVRRRAGVGEWLMLAWIVPYAAVTMAFQVKFLRYLVPVMPFMTILAGYVVYRIARSTSQRPWWRWVRVLPAALAVAGTAAYAFAFMQIYTQPLTRVTASEWIYRNIPAGKSITDEAWDDSLPLARVVDGVPRAQGEYKVVTMNLHEPDDATKLVNLRQWLTTADYVIISSNRMYGWLPRVTDRFPLTRHYYDLLFAGQLGYEPVATFTSYPRLGPFAFNDDHADESFTVYDHPKVLVFRKIRNLRADEFAQLFADVPAARQPQPSTAAVAARSPSLLLDQPVDQLPVVNDRAWNGLANASPLFAIIVWWIVVQFVSLAGLAATVRIFHRWADRGYLFAKSLGLLTVAWLMWMLGSLHILMHTALVLWVIVALLAILSAYLLYERRDAILAFIRANRRMLLFEEALFGLAFLLFVGIRMLNPDLWQPWNGGEKSMEFAFLNAILKSPYFPPYDPYFAGGYINYYYYGIYVVGVLVKLSGITPAVAFNLAIPTLFALTVSNAFSVAFNAGTMRAGHASRSRAIMAGLLAALFVAAIGNLDGLVQVVDGLGRAGGSEFKSSIIGVEGLVKGVAGLPAVLFGGKSIPPFDYWRSSRVVPFTINEFPLWSFLFADLHPHMIGMPFTLLVIGLAAHALRRPAASMPPPGAELDGTAELATPLGADSLHERGVSLFVGAAPPPDDSTWPTRILTGAALALTLGAIAAINTWDAPTYLGLALGALLLRRHWTGAGHWPGTFVSVGIIGAASLALYLPFFSHYKALYVGLGLSDIHTDFQPFVIVWGLFLFVGVSFVAGEVARRSRDGSPAAPVAAVLRQFMRLPRLLELGEQFGMVAAANQLALAALAALTTASIVLVLLNLPVIAFLIWPFALTALLLTRRGVEPRAQLATWLAFWAFAILLGVEVVYLQDFLGGEWKRMNTLFKFYIQVWVLLALVAGIALPDLWSRVNAQRGLWPAIWHTALGTLVAAAMLFSVFGTYGRVNDRFPNARPPLGTLNGLDYMSVGVYSWPDDKNTIEMKYDLDAIRWLQDNVSGTPVIAEAAIGYYREGGMRVSSYTGLPTLLGMHQGEQRYSDDVGQRDGEAREFFNTVDTARAMDLIRMLHIRYVYIGQLERATYAPGGLDKFDAMVKAGVLDVAYRNPKVIIYRVKG